MKTCIRAIRATIDLHKSENGQFLVLAAGAMVAVLGISALAIDVGFFAHTKRDVQNDADAMATAGVRELPSQGDATTFALDWGDRNNVSSGEVQSIVYDTRCDSADAGCALRGVSGSSLFLRYRR